MSSVSREAVARAVKTMIRWRPCTFYVEHNAVTTSGGGRQTDPQTRGPFRGMLAAPGSVRLPFTSLQEIVSTPGTAMSIPRWNLLCMPNVNVAHGGAANDYVSVNGFGRFEVKAVRPVADISPAVGLVVSMDQLA